VDPRTLEAIFPKELIRQEVSGDRFVQIPEKIRGAYRLWRPTPMYRVCTHGSISFGRSDELLPWEGPPNRELNRVKMSRK
jgi:hypothetical protein